jgi:hypothetical protein
MRGDNSTEQGTPGMDKFSSVVDRMHLKLGDKLLNSLRTKTQLPGMIQCASVVNGANHTQEEDVESNGSSLKNCADIFVLFLSGMQMGWFWGLISV